MRVSLRAAEPGRSPISFIDHCCQASTYSSIFNLSDPDVGGLGASAGWSTRRHHNQIPLCRLLLWSKKDAGAIGALFRKNLSPAQGYDLMMRLAQGTTEQNACTRRSIAGWPALMMFRTFRTPTRRQRESQRLEDHASRMTKLTAEMR